LRVKYETNFQGGSHVAFSYFNQLKTRYYADFVQEKRTAFKLQKKVMYLLKFVRRWLFFYNLIVSLGASSNLLKINILTAKFFCLQNLRL
jgi:hypothetical protein